jgi:hypothetical protein
MKFDLKQGFGIDLHYKDMGIAILLEVTEALNEPS